MQTEQERRRLLAEFVDRTDEMARFQHMLESDEKHIMVVWGGPGLGKTSLRLRMVHECAQRKLRKAEVECGGFRTTGYLSVMRKIRDDVGLEYFNAFSDYANFLTDPNYKPQISLNINLQGANMAVAGQAQISGSSVGDIAGVVIKDNMLVLPRTDIAVPEEERMIRLTDWFIEGLNAALREGPVVVFLDGVEKMDPDTQRWLWEELLMAVRDGRVAGVKVVLCGQLQPQLDRDWRMLVEEAELRPLSLEHIEAYLEKRGVPDALRSGLAVWVLADTKGEIAKIAAQVDAFLALQQKMAHG
jgi:hypothetical protein